MVRRFMIGLICLIPKSNQHKDFWLTIFRIVCNQSIYFMIKKSIQNMSLTDNLLWLVEITATWSIATIKAIQANLKTHHAQTKLH